MDAVVPLLAHIGSPNNPWIGVVTVSSWALMVVLVLVLTKRLAIEAPGDLLLPLAAVVMIAGLSGSTPDWINDQGPWAAPMGVVLLVALLVVAFRESVTLEAFNRATVVTLVAAVVAAAAAYVPLNDLWFPETADEVLLPALEDGTVTATLVSGPDEDGALVIRVEVADATLGAAITGIRPDDPETGLVPRFQVGPVYLTPPTPQACAEAAVCTSAEFEMTLPSTLVAEPPDEIVVELLAADGLPFVPPLLDRVPLTAAG